MKRYPILIFTSIYMVSFLFVCICLPYGDTQKTYVPRKYIVCLDAGHGGIDGGAIGSFAKESDINLEIAKKLTKLLIACQIEVINTRTSDICLCDEQNPKFKLEDMKKRREIIQNSNADLMISIHCNKFSQKSSVGAQVFYQKDSKQGEIFAKNMTKQLVLNLPNARNFALSGDYYVLASTKCPAILIECGYISNPEEERLLASDEYQQKVAYTIYCGIIQFLATY